MALNTRKYIDFDIAFTAHPVTGDLVKKKDYSAVSQSIKNLVFLNHYEKPFHPEIGCNVRKMLFELINPSVASALRTEIVNTIGNFEPRAKINEVVVKPNYTEDGYDITIVYTTINLQNPIKINFFLERLR